VSEGGQNATILLVEDDEALRLLCRTVLELDGYRVVEALTQQGVGQMLAAGPVRAVLLDVHLGDENGIDIARSLRASNPELPIILFSGSAQLYGSAAEELAVAIISKPFEVDELLRVVKRVST